MLLADLPTAELRFRTNDAAEQEIRGACAANPDRATFHEIGYSREGRRLYGVTLGRGPRTVTLVAGAHADEPVGPETLRTLILELLTGGLRAQEAFGDLLERYTFRMVPHANPDGEARNQPWVARWPEVEPYLLHRVREQPGDDVEFGYPVMRPENRAVSRFLFDYRPITLHVSLHGMGFAEGALLLIERHWAARAELLKESWRHAVAAAGLRLHDHDRGGEKGFRYYGPGFWSAPEGEPMRRYFRDRGDHATASQFFHSSMEWARLSGYDADRQCHPLALVTELPLFVIEKDYDRTPGVPSAYLELQQELHRITELLRHGDDVQPLLAPFRLRAIPLEAAVRLQLRAIEIGLETCSS